MSLQTKEWKILALFDKPVLATDVVLSPVPLTPPGGFYQIVRENWVRNLEAMQAKLALEGKKTEIRLYQDGKYSALYDGGKCISWPGPMLTFEGYRQHENKVIINVAETVYAVHHSIKDKTLQELYARNNMPMPKPFGISTYAITADNKLVFTVRGQQTRFPGFLCGQAGAPTTANQEVLEHQQEEMEEEILVSPKDYDSEKMVFGGLIEYLVDSPGETNPFGWVPINLTSKQVAERVNARPFEKRPKDAVDVAFAPADEKGLFEYVLFNTKRFPSIYVGGMVLYGHHMFGSEWSKSVLKKLKTMDS